MNISTLNQIKEDDVFLYYTLSDKDDHNLWVGDSDKADEIAKIIIESYGKKSGFSIFYGSFTNEEHSEEYLGLIECNNEIRMIKGDWNQIIDFFQDDKNQSSEMRTTIPLFKKYNKQEEVDSMSTMDTNAITGAQVVTTAKSGELFVSLKHPQVVIKRNNDGVLIYEDTKEGVIIDNKFLNESFVPYVAEKKPKRNYLTLPQALKAFADGVHIHFDMEADGEFNEDICVNQFLPISSAVMEIVEDEGPLQLVKFLEAFKRDLNSGVEEAAELMNPMNAKIPVEVLIKGKFFITEEEEDFLI